MHGWLDLFSCIEELGDRQAGGTNEAPKRASGYLFVVRYRQRGNAAWFDEDYVGASLAGNLPSQGLEGFDYFAPAKDRNRRH